MSAATNNNQWADPWSKNYSLKEDHLLRPMMTDYLTEEEIKTMIENAVSRGADGIAVAAFLKSLDRHFSEEFVLNYYKYFSEFGLLKEYCGDIYSGNYPSLALKYQAEDK